MKRNLLAVTALLTIGILAAAPRFSSAQAATPWPTFHGNIERNGLSTSPGPAQLTAQRIWQLPKAVESSPAVDANGIAYVGDDDGYLYALDPSQTLGPFVSPSPKWSFKTAGKVVSSPTLSADGKMVFFGSDDGKVYALTTADGKQVWSVDIGGEVRASPLLTADGSTLMVTNVNGNIRALATADGSKVWGPINLGTAVDGSLTLSPDGSTFYVAGYASVMYAIPATGSNAGKQVTTTFYLTGPAIATPAIDGNGNIYVTTLNGTLDSFSPGSGTERSGFPYVASDHAASVSTPAIGTGIVIFGDNNGNLYDVSPSSGQPVWNSFPHAGAAIGSSPAIASNGVVYVGSDDGNVYAFSTATGQIISVKRAGAAVSSSPAIGPDKSVWVGSQAGVVYRFQELSLPPTPSQQTSTPTATPTGSPVTATTTPTSTCTSGSPPSIKLKSSVKAGSQQVITVTSTPKAVIRFRVQYPNGDHQSKRLTANSKGIATYKYIQGSSKTLHNRFTATVIVKAGNPPCQTSATATYKIKFGKIDASVEPRTQSPGKVVNIYVHTTLSKRVVASVLFPNGKSITLTGHTGPHGFMHKRLPVTSSMVRGANRKVKVVARLQLRPAISTQTTFTIK
jgi:outer membrane protein assembly factor BamB